ncbi:MAG: 5'-methylthioadenosine/adenosylhomocysteine nucleosidase [Porcipelethomonas sp.]
MKTIGIIGAMPSELADIRKSLAGSAVKKYAGYEFYINTYEGRLIVSACCGIAKVNAALCAQVMIDRFDVDAIINTGVAGGMNTNVKVCDIVVSDSVLPHDLELRFLENYPPYSSTFSSDKRLMDCAVDVCRDFGINSHIGRVVSGEAFISSNEVKKEICDRLSPLAVDMESAAVGQCAFRNEVPYVSIRCISDNADDEGDMSFDEFEKIAAGRVAEVVLEMVKRL